jgi:hypothetical protein
MINRTLGLIAGDRVLIRFSPAAVYFEGPGGSLRLTPEVHLNSFGRIEAVGHLSVSAPELQRIAVFSPHAMRSKGEFSNFLRYGLFVSRGTSAWWRIVFPPRVRVAGIESLVSFGITFEGVKRALLEAGVSRVTNVGESGG